MIRPRHWIIALGLALGVHLLTLGLVLAREPAQGARAPGEQGIEIDLGMLGDLGADTQNRQAAKPEQMPEQLPESLQPQQAPTPEPAVAPEPISAGQTPELEVKAPEPTPKPVPKQKSKPVTPSSSAGKDSSDSRRMTTGSQNALSSGGNPAAEQSYYALIAARLAQHKRYPIRARKKGEEGTARLFFILDRRGSLIEYRLSESSGVKSLDRAVIDMLKSAAPLPAFPADMPMQTLTVNIPVVFSIN
ncbi:energy transducer TonB [Marinobacterium sedimentorum]|uniref:energy transducer TonB n=1 Tax=Marinobacterium sedimentorum TaxID=2927804 RepID=UPI0020C60069|nr:energy transducer TonB [Marinobacterium sedimentorum]MCP8687570.1 energy transducer TonB [Marinobacterium sedimentorum]